MNNPEEWPGLDGVKVGDEVIVRGYRDDRTANEVIKRYPVVKVGRTLCHVQILRFGKPTPFELETGTERRPATAGGTGQHAYTEGGWATKERWAIAMRAVAPLIRDHGRGFSPLTTDQLERIGAIINEGTGT